MNSQTKTNKAHSCPRHPSRCHHCGHDYGEQPRHLGTYICPLRHAEWNGLTPTDLVFPFFMFIMGISTYISLKKYNFEFSHAAAMKILKRTIIIFLIGLAIGWLSRFCYYWAGSHEGLSFGEQLWASVWTFDRIRILGVMQRLALCYGATAIIALTMKHRHIPYLIATLLVGYFILLMCGNGFAYNETNILSIVDRAILTPAHMYKDNGIDPEGLLSTIPSIAHVLLGFCVGRMMLDSNRAESREALLNSHLIKLFLVGAILTFAGFLLSYGCPINKKIWSPTFVLTTCGLASSFLALLIWIIDVKDTRNGALSSRLSVSTPVHVRSGWSTKYPVRQHQLPLGRWQHQHTRILIQDRSYADIR